MMLESGMLSCASRVYGGVPGGVKALRVSRFWSCAVGADAGGGGGLREEKPEMAQRVMLFSMPRSVLSDLERIRSLWKVTLGGC